MEDFQGDAHFYRVLGDSAHEHDEFRIKPKEEIKRLVLCSGQVWAALSKMRQEKNITGLTSNSPLCLLLYYWGCC